MADETSTEPTPENLRGNCHPFCIRKPELSCATCRDWLATADLIESQQARIEELEAKQHPDVFKVAVCEALLAINAEDPEHPFIPPTAIDWLGNDIVAYLIAASPDTPETRP